MERLSAAMHDLVHKQLQHSTSPSPREARVHPGIRGGGRSTARHPYL